MKPAAHPFKPNSQNAQILAILQSGQSLTHYQAAQMGIMAFTARINEIRAAGFPVVCRMEATKNKHGKTEKRTPPAPKPCLAAIALPAGAGSLNYTFAPLGYFPSKRAAKAAVAQVLAQHPEAVYLIFKTRRQGQSVIFDLLAQEAQKQPESTQEKQP